MKWPASTGSPVTCAQFFQNFRRFGAGGGDILASPDYMNRGCNRLPRVDVTFVVLEVRPSTGAGRQARRNPAASVFPRP